MLNPFKWCIAFENIYRGFHNIEQKLKIVFFGNLKYRHHHLNFNKISCFFIGEYCQSNEVDDFLLGVLFFPTINDFFVSYDRNIEDSYYQIVVK